VTASDLTRSRRRQVAHTAAYRIRRPLHVVDRVKQSGPQIASGEVGIDQHRQQRRSRVVFVRAYAQCAIE